MFRVHYCGAGMAGVQTTLRVLGSSLVPGFSPSREAAGVGWETAINIGARSVVLRITADAKRQLYPVEDVTRPGLESPGFVAESHALARADGVVFVVDSSGPFLERSIGFVSRTLRHLEQLGSSLPVRCVVQLNKRDLSDAVPVEEIVRRLRLPGLVGCFETSAVSGSGVVQGIASLVQSIALTE